MRGLFRWAADAGHVKADPTAGVRYPPKRKSAGFPAWTEDDVARYEARWPIGTKERVWLGVLLYMGLRRGDAVCLGRQHVRDSVATIRTKKNGITVALPILPVLDDILRAGPCGDLAFICGERGQPLTKESFGNLFRAACTAAGVAKSAHGVRKIGATRAANAGATVAELEAIFGWQGGGMASLYTRTADRARLAKGAMSMLARTTGEQTIPAPSGKVRDSARKERRYQISDAWKSGGGRTRTRTLDPLIRGRGSARDLKILGRPKVSNRPLKINDLGQFCQTGGALKLTLFNSIFARTLVYVGRGSCATNHDLSIQESEAA
jgi:hypothetical protein